MHIITFIPVLFLLMQPIVIYGEVFTALVDMEGLVSTELELVRHLDNYIQAEETRLKQLRKYLEEYESIYQEASADVTKYLANPINAYLLVKRLTADWKQVEGVMTQNVGPAFVHNITQHRGVLRFPSDEDLNGAAVALMRLQDTYKLDTHALAEGKLLGKKYSRQLTAGDCWELGRQSYNNGDHYHTVLWMGEALNKYEAESNKTVTRQDILEYLAFSTFKQGNVKEALQLTHELLKIVPFHQRALGNKKYYEDLLRQQGVIQRRGETGDVDNMIMDEPFNTANLKLTKPSDQLPERENYEKLCRGEKLMDPKVEGRLRCRLVTNNVPFYYIQPIKMEEANHKPLIVIYHDVISDDEMETVKKMAQPRFKRATVQNSVTGNLEPANYRISKSAWLKSEEHDHIFKVTRRVGDITGLDMATAEDLQVVNYGIGGHYEPHFDYARKEEVNAFKDLGWGNRIATWLFYMSDVEAGGATVFPKLNLALWPQKGSAAFWYNLHANGEGNELTRHAACPVLTGSKWVSNKWIHERNQEFRHPCGLKYDTGI
ncbi:prolyl 4-hydroxylase subunit alpha-1-like [Daphnia carinata]|uniref:prolyl 4-hydroxylase subunit alpha-1-like n=1 Tax=Daphnia carinata TaxID=120202 RepID=UPI00257D2CDA|nr:prolyl 4-hydroxylase subunit alpha-1-like [Daphnia carinata]XP_057378431.1 prolyl 4-hydroxylase subunit alpha-1-like [Daphnia carinata]XP_057378432.1 prolyl 4-hydroxylase subunit alpha-1-like [Daphnia carinata]XP_057378433.1 prolyl 4-hydroxylase subunit alpha-1-like [Daphnia carinata]